MLMHLRDFLCGWRNMTVQREAKSRVMHLLYREHLPFVHVGRTADGQEVLRLREKDFQRFSAGEEAGYTAGEVHGWPVMRAFLRRRPMLPIGGMLTALLLGYTGNLVWDIRIEGNTKTPDAAILETLQSLGFEVGTYLPSVNFNDLHARYAAAQNDIAWLSIYMDGTVAEVQVRELYRDEREKHAPDTYANVVAGQTGIIEEIHVKEGQAAVRTGELVREGQLLISGMVEAKDGRVRAEYADGEIFAVTVVPLEVQVRTEREEIVPTGREKVEKTWRIFKKRVNLFRKGRIAYGRYDKISTMEQVCLFPGCALPLWVEKTVYRETAAVQKTVTAEEAAEEAMAELRRKIKEETARGELTAQEWSASFEEGVYTVRCLLTMRRDIARTQTYTIQPPAEAAPVS